MKRLVLSALGGILTLGAMAQDDAMKQIECKALTDAVTKNVKNTENAKRSTKSATWISLGDAYVDLASRCTDDSTAALKAENAYAKALEVEKAAGGKKSSEIEALLKSEKLSSAYLMQGVSYYNSKNYKKASEYLGKSSDLNLKDTTAALYAGIAYQLNENNDGAVKYLQNYINQNGKDPSIFYSISQIYRSEKKFDEAVEILKKGIAANPQNKDLPNELINVYLTSNNVDKAIADLETMTKNDPSNAVNITNLGQIYDLKAQEIGSELNKINDKIEESNTEKLDKKLLAEQDKLGAYDAEIASLNAKLKREPKTAAATRKRITEVTEQKAQIEKDIASVIADIQKKKSASGNLDELKAKAQDLSAKQKASKNKAVENYTKVLNIDANNYDALYNLAVINYNDAVEIKKVVDHMDIATYRREGKAIEDKACEQFAVSKPYFEKASKIKPEEEIVKETLSNLERILEQCKK
jgi:tetratricopeptide (TPR) repeat protein